MAIIEGTAYWASLTRPNEKFEPMWRIDLAVDDKSANELKEQGIALGETTIDEKTIPKIVRFKRKVKRTIRRHIGAYGDLHECENLTFRIHLGHNSLDVYLLNLE